jgi:hypothetical protein
MKGRETEKEERKCNSQNGKMLLEYDVLVLSRERVREGKR